MGGGGRRTPPPGPAARRSRPCNKLPTECPNTWRMRCAGRLSAGGTSSTSRVVSLLIYEFLKLIRGTRAVQMAVGSLLVIVLFYVSQLAPLQTVNWLIRNMLVYVAFAAIVIFQSDIRRALAHFGQAPFFRYFNRQEAADEVDRGGGGRGDDAGAAAHRRDRRHRARDRAAELHRERHSARRDADLRPARHDLPARFPAARRRGRSCRRTGWPPPPASCR